MLKIKAERMGELEKFGFVDNSYCFVPENYYYYYQSAVNCDGDDIYDCEISVDKITRIIDFDYSFAFNPKDDDETWIKHIILSKFMELVKADMVEEV